MSSLHNTGFTGFNPINLAGPNMGQNQSSSSHAPKTRPGHSRCSHQPDVDNLSVQDLTANSIWLGKHFLPKGLVGEATKARYAPTNPSRDFVPSGTKNEKRHLTCETCLNFGRSRALTLIFQYMQQGTNLIRVVPFKVGRDNLLYVVLVPIVPRRQSLPYAQKTSFGLLKVDGSVSHEMRFTASAQSFFPSVHEQAEHFDKVLPLDESISSPVLQNRTTPTTSKQESQSSNVFNVNPTDSSKTVPSLRCPEQMQDANKLNSESSERLVSFGKQPDSSQSQSQEPLSRDTPSRSKFDKYSQTEDSLAPKELEELSREALEHEMRSSPPLSATENHSHSTPAFRLKSTPACSPGRSDPTNNKNSTAAMLPSTSVSERDSTETNKPQPLDSSHLDESTRSIIEETALEGVAPAGTNAAHTGTNGLALIQETSTEEEDDYEEIMKELKAAKEEGRATQERKRKEEEELASMAAERRKLAEEVAREAEKNDVAKRERRRKAIAALQKTRAANAEAQSEELAQQTAQKRKIEEDMISALKRQKLEQAQRREQEESEAASLLQ